MSDSDTTDTFNLKKLDAFVKAFTSNDIQVRVGILGGKNERNDTSISNSTIGAAHEYGTSKIRRRSFLRMPLSTELPKVLAEKNAITDQDLQEILKTNTVTTLAKKLGTQAVAVVLKAFDTGGFGTWAPLNPKTLAEKKVKQILVETHQLRDSVTFDIKKTK